MVVKREIIKKVMVVKRVNWKEVVEKYKKIKLREMEVEVKEWRERRGLKVKRKDYWMKWSKEVKK